MADENTKSVLTVVADDANIPAEIGGYNTDEIREAVVGFLGMFELLAAHLGVPTALSALMTACGNLGARFLAEEDFRKALLNIVDALPTLYKQPEFNPNPALETRKDLN